MTTVKKKLKKSDEVSITEAADMYNIPRTVITKKVQKGEIDAEKKGWVWMIKVGDLPKSIHYKGEDKTRETQ